MAISLLHTPEGVRDRYNEECAKKETVSAKIGAVFHRFGYRSIQTPSYEFFDIFNKDRGSVASNQMFKFFDRDGNTLVLRPDITPSIARCAAKYFMDEDMPVRLCYNGNIFINNMSLRGSLKESTVMGAEMINDTTTDADAEMVAMLIQSLQVSGLTEFQVEIGQVDFFNGLVEEEGFNEQETDELRTLIEQKNYFGVEEMLSAKELPEQLKQALLSMPKLFGGISQIHEAASLTDNDKALSAIYRLEKLYKILASYGLEKYITFDLGMLGKFQYYTGIIFKAYTYGSGTPIATGGRYDKLLSQFGKDAPSIGFGIYVDELLMAMSRQQIDIDTDYLGTILLYERSQKDLAIRLANVLRADSSVTLMKKFYEKTIDDYIAYAKRSGIGGIFYIDEEGKYVEVINVLTDDRKRHLISDLIGEEA